MKPRYAGIIELDVDLLLKILDLEGGEIHDIHMRDEHLPHTTIHMVIEHPDLPEVIEGERLERVVISHKITYGKNGVPIKIERADPPKQNKEG